MWTELKELNLSYNYLENLDSSLVCHFNILFITIRIIYFVCDMIYMLTLFEFIVLFCDLFGYPARILELFSLGLLNH